MKQNIYKVFFIAGLCAVLGIGGTTAYYSFFQKTSGVLSIGECQTGIVEEFVPPKEMHTGDNTYQKRVQVENTGSIACYVRVYADFSDDRVEKNSFLSPDGKTFVAAEDYAEHLPAGWEYVSLEEDSLLGGFFYFTDFIEAGERTSPLFEQVRTHFDSADEITDYEIVVTSESVQARDRNGELNDGPEGYRQAWTEFLERR